MLVIYETDEDKYYDKEELKIFKKGAQSGIESRGSGIFLPGSKYGSGLYLPTRERHGEGASEGEGVIDAILSAGKTVIEGIANNSSTIGQAASAVGSVASAASNVANAVKSFKQANQASVTPLSGEELERQNKEFREMRMKREEERRGTGFK